VLDRPVLRNITQPLDAARLVLRVSRQAHSSGSERTSGGIWLVMLAERPRPEYLDGVCARAVPTPRTRCDRGGPCACQVRPELLRWAGRPGCPTCCAAAAESPAWDRTVAPSRINPGQAGRRIQACLL
jgi:hypothetical protein